MSLTLSQTYSAIGPNLTSSFLASGGSSPYIYSVVPGGAGGTINSSTGIYTAPSSVSENPPQLYDTIQVTDLLSNTATAQVLVGTPLLLFCEVIQNQLSLDNSHCFLWDEKIFQPTDSSLYVIVSVMSCKPYSNITHYDGSGSGLNAIQAVNMYALLDINIISRGPAARDRKEEVILALNSTYAEQQQEANSFYIGRLPPGSSFKNISQIDGAAIPYRFVISCALQYVTTKTTAIPYFNNFSDQIAINP